MTPNDEVVIFFFVTNSLTSGEYQTSDLMNEATLATQVIHLTKEFSVGSDRHRRARS